MQPAEAGTPTNFAYSGNAFGSNFQSADPNAGSGRTVLAVLGCTVSVPEQDNNRAVETTQPGAPLTTGTVQTYSKSKQVPGGFATASRSRVQNVSLGDAAAALVVNDLDVIAIAAFKNGDAVPTIKTDIGNARLEVAGQPTQDISLDQLREGFEVPGFGTVTLARGSKSAGPNSATANAVGLRIETDGGGRSSVGVANARIDRVVGRGPFSGGATVNKGTIGEDGSRTGPLLVRPMPCRGTGGRTLTEDLARARQGDDLKTRDARVSVFTRKFGSGAAVGKSRASVERFFALDDDLEITNIVANVSVLRRTDGSYAKSIEGTRVGSITYQDENVDVPDPGETEEIPGVARFTTGIVGSGRGSRSVVALRVELLDGSATRLDVATARVKLS